MVQASPGMVFIHGAWHSHHTWDEVVPHLAERGFMVRVLDLPGAGANAKSPVSFSKRPLDPAAFATEPSPNAGVTQDERTEAVIQVVRETAEACGGKVVLAGHSLGGLTVSHVTQRVPELIAAAVYITAFMLPPDMPAVAMIMDETMSEALVPGLFCADPEKVGALRIDVASEDPDYVARIKEAFYGDVDEETFQAARSTLHCDEPAQVALVPSPVTKERFGAVRRHYVRCMGDRAITPAGQAKMISAMDAAMGNATMVHIMETSHSPFDADPKGLVDILAGIAAG